MKGGYCGCAAEPPKAIPLKGNLCIEGIGDVQLEDLNKEENGMKFYKMTYTNTEGKSCQCEARLCADGKLQYNDWPLIRAQPQARFQQLLQFGSQYLVTLS